MEEKPRLEDRMRSLAAVWPKNSHEHPSLNTLAAYGEGTLSAEETESLQDHLALCPGCTETLLEFTAFLQNAEEGSASISDKEVRAEWHRFTAKVRDRNRDPSIPPQVAKPRIGRNRFAYILAAALFISAIGLSVWVALLTEKLNKQTRPRFSNMLLDLTPGNIEMVRRGELVEQRIHFSQGSQDVLLLLNRADPWPEGECRVTLSDDSGKTVWRREFHNTPSDSMFSLLIPKHYLHAGQYQIRVEELQDTTINMLAEYVMSIEYER